MPEVNEKLHRLLEAAEKAWAEHHLTPCQKVFVIRDDDGYPTECCLLTAAYIAIHGLDPLLRMDNNTSIMWAVQHWTRLDFGLTSREAYALVDGYDNDPSAMGYHTPETQAAYEAGQAVRIRKFGV